jgi:hypothetical protein
MLSIDILSSSFNSVTAKLVPVEIKSSCLEGFWLAKHKHTNIPTMIEPFALALAWFCWLSILHPQEPMQKGLAEASVKGFKMNQ